MRFIYFERRLRGIVFGAATALAVAAPAMSQARQAPPAPPQPMTTPIPTQEGAMFLEVGGGASAVEKAGGAVNARVGFAVSNRLAVFGEGEWMQNVATRRRLDLGTTLASFLQTSQGSAASSALTAPAFYVGGGVNVFLKTHGSVRPYVSASVGLARVVLKPAFTLAGADVTTVLGQYGVTLGSDLTGASTVGAFGGGLGVRWLKGAWYIDAGFGVRSLRTAAQVTNVVRAGADVGFEF